MKYLLALLFLSSFANAQTINPGGGSNLTTPISVANGGTGNSTGQATSLFGSQLTTYSNINMEGDSIGCGTGAANSAACSTLGFANQLATNGAMLLTNRAIQGEMACDMDANEVFQNENPGLLTSNFYAAMIGTNEAQYKGTGAYEPVYQSCHQAALTWLSVPKEYKTFANSSSCVTTGTWSADSTWVSSVGETSSTNGSTITCTFTGYGTQGVFWYKRADSTPGTFSWNLDSGAKTGNATTQTTPTISTQNGGTTGFSPLYLGTVSSATHTLVITVTSATGGANAVSFGAVGVVPPVTYWQAPIVFSTGVIEQQNNTQAAASLQYDTDAQADNTFVSGLGFNVRNVPVRPIFAALCPGQTSACMYNNYHPNLIGHQYIAQAIQAVAQFPTAQATGGTAGTLGTSASVSSPQAPSDATTGLYTSGSGHVDISGSGTQVADFTSSGGSIFYGTGSSGLAFTATSANTSSTYFNVSNTSTGGHIYQFASSGSGNAGGIGSFGVVDTTAQSIPLAIYGGSSGSGGTGSLVIMPSDTTEVWNSGTGFSSPLNSGDTGLSRLASAKLAVGNGTNGDFSGKLIAGGIGIGTATPNALLDVGNSSGSALRVAPTASEVDYAQISGGISGNPGNVTITAAGSDTNINLALSGQGAGVVTTGGLTATSTIQAARFIPVSATSSTNSLYLPAANTLGLAAQSNPVAEFTNPASAVDYFTLTGSVAGSPGVLTLAATGSDTNISMALTPKGTGKIQITGLTTGTNADFLCVDASGNILEQASACTISQRNLKENFSEISGTAAIDDLMSLKPKQFNFKDVGNGDPNADKTQYGFIADEVSAVDPKLSIYENDMKTPKSYRQEAMISLLVKGFQEHQKELQAITGNKMIVVGHKCFFNILVCAE